MNFHEAFGADPENKSGDVNVSEETPKEFLEQGLEVAETQQESQEISEKENPNENIEAADAKQEQALREKIKGEEKEEQIDYSEKSKEEMLESIRTQEHSSEELFAMLKALKEQGYKFEIEGMMNNISQKMADRDSTKDTREDFGADIIHAIKDAIAAERVPANFLDGFKRMISIGSGHGENPYGISKEFANKETELILIDPYAAPSEGIAKDSSVVHLGQRFEDVKIVAGEGEKNIVEASNFLQLYEREEKVEMLKKMIRIAGVGGKLIIVDEIERPGRLNKTADYVLNRFYNRAQGKYERMKPGEYEDMFDNLKLKRFTSGETDQYNRGSVLFMLEVTRESMDLAIEE